MNAHIQLSRFPSGDETRSQSALCVRVHARCTVCDDWVALGLPVHERDQTYYVLNTHTTMLLIYLLLNTHTEIEPVAYSSTTNQNGSEPSNADQRGACRAKIYMGICLLFSRYPLYYSMVFLEICTTSGFDLQRGAPDINLQGNSI